MIEMRKAAVSVVILVFIGVTIVMVVQFLDKMPILNKIVNVEQGVDVILELSDESGKLIHLLSFSMPGANVMDAIVMEIAGLEYDGSFVTEMADDMDTTILVYDENGKTKKLFGRRRLGNVVHFDIPLPGGETGRIGILMDTRLPEEVEIQ